MLVNRVIRCLSQLRFFNGALRGMEMGAALRCLGILYIKQCNSFASLRLRRMLLLYQLYKRLYGERSMTGLLRNVVFRLNAYRKNIRPIGGSMLLASAAGFSFGSRGITDDEMNRIATSVSGALLKHRGGFDDLTTMENFEDNSSLWEPVVDKSSFKMFRKLRDESRSLYEYKCFGTFNDVPAAAFFVTQIDLDYRKTWDNFVILLEVVDRDPVSGSDIVRWISRFPYPMYAREYIFVRRACLDPHHNLMILVSRSVEHPGFPQSDNYVRVEDYESSIVIRAHKNIFESGFDYILTYCDDPKVSISAPTRMVSTGVQNYVEQVYKASVALLKQRKLNPGPVMSFVASNRSFGAVNAQPFKTALLDCSNVNCGSLRLN